MKDGQADPHVAVAGAGYCGKNLLRNFHDLNALTAICDVDEELAQVFQEQYPEARILSM